MLTRFQGLIVASLPLVLAVGQSHSADESQPEAKAPENKLSILDVDQVVPVKNRRAPGWGVHELL